MSEWRLKEFNKCRDKTNPNISEILGSVSYHSKMTDKQLLSLVEYMALNQIDFKTLLTYDGMDHLSKEVLCRWLRPSELQRLSVMMKQDKMTIYRGTMQLQLHPHTTPGYFVGILGQNLIALTQKYNLLYAWYHNSNKSLILYSLNKGNIQQAMTDPLVSNFKIDSIINEQIGKSDWSRIGKITNMRTYANVVAKPTTTQATRAPQQSSVSKRATTTSSKKATSKKPSSPKNKTYINSRTYANVVKSKPKTKVARA